MEPPHQPDDSGSITLQLPAQYRYLAIARDAALEACQRMCLGEFDGYKVEMAVDEACTNIIEHSYHGETPAEHELDHPGITLEFTPHPGRLTIEIVDRGEGFALDDAGGTDPPRESAVESEPGLGLYIIRRFVDTVEYRQDPLQGNRLRLTKNC